MKGNRGNSAARGQSQVTVVTGVIGSDMHFVGNTILRYALKVAQIKSLQNTRHVLNLLRGQRLPDSAELNAECDLLTAEATAIVDWALEKGDGDATSGSVKAFDAGVIDLPFSSNVFNANKVKVGMAEDGKMRYVDCGNLPIPADIAEFHRAEIERGKKHLGLKHDWEMVLAAVYAQTASHP